MLTTTPIIFYRIFLSKWECNLIAQNEILAKSLASNKQLSKRAAVQALLKAMQQFCYTLEVRSSTWLDFNLKTWKYIFIE